MDEAVFTRTDTPAGVRFDVTPARGPAGSVAFLKSGMGCLGVFMGALFGIIGAVVAGFVLNIPLTLLLGAGLGAFVGGWAGVAVGVVIFIWRLRAYTKPLERLNVDRSPVSLLVSPKQGIQFPGGTITAEDIAELALRNPYDKGGYEVTTTVVDDTAAGAARQWGLQKGVEIRNCSFALILRRKAISTPVILVQGLTWNTGRALAEDVRAVLARGA